MLFTKQKNGYQSEITLFLESLKKANPKLEQSQLDGRALLWDQAPRSLDEQERTLNGMARSGSH